MLSTAMEPSSSLPLPRSTSAISATSTPASDRQAHPAGKDQPTDRSFPTNIDFSSARHKSNKSVQHSTPLPFFAKRGSPPFTPPRSAARDNYNPPSSYTGPELSHTRSLSNTTTQSERVDVPARTTSLRRKPVPSMITLPNATLPSSHPFASATSSASIPSVPTTPYSPGTRPDEELFFVPPRSGPLPPRRPKSDRGTERSNSPASSTMDMTSREELLRAREEALQAREDALREREEFIKREEALRQREDELRAREHAMSIRETASTPGSVSTPVMAQTPRALGAPITVSTPTSRDRPLPSLPDPSQVNLRTSSDSMPSPVTPTSADMADHNTINPNFQFAAHPNSISEKGEKSSHISHASHATHASRAVSKPRSNKTKKVFSVDAKPSQEDLIQASGLFVRDEEGQLVCFGDFLPHPHSPPSSMPGDVPAGTENETLPPITKTVVFFIRSFWCGQCQDYTIASLASIDPVAVRRAGVRVVVISIGNYKVIKAYRRILKCPFPLYVDGPRKLYGLLGMKSSQSFGSLTGRAAYHQSSVPSQIVKGVGNAFFKFPLAAPGSLSQLGGEFVFSPNNTCDFAHRMTTRSNHMEAPEVLRVAGVSGPIANEIKEFALEESQKAELDRMAVEMEQWRVEREAEIERIRQRKLDRRTRGLGSTSSPLNSGDGFEDSLEDEIEFDEYLREEYANGPRAQESVSMSVTSDFSIAFEDVLRMDREELSRRRRKASGQRTDWQDLPDLQEMSDMTETRVEVGAK